MSGSSSAIKSMHGALHVGLARQHQEDELLMRPEHGVALVADGMGGQSSGGIASRAARDTVSHYLDGFWGDDEDLWYVRDTRAGPLSIALELANEQIFARSRPPGMPMGQGATVAALRVWDAEVTWAHVGDVRVYWMREGTLEVMTEDHSLLREAMLLGVLSEEDIASFPHRNVVTRALGMAPTIELELGSQPVRAGDAYLLCSDGLHGELEHRDIERILAAMLPDTEAAVDALLAAALATEARDNIGLCVVQL